MAAGDERRVFPVLHADLGTSRDVARGPGRIDGRGRGARHSSLGSRSGGGETGIVDRSSAARSSWVWRRDRSSSDERRAASSASFRARNAWSSASTRAASPGVGVGVAGADAARRLSSDGGLFLTPTSDRRDFRALFSAARGVERALFLDRGDWKRWASNGSGDSSKGSRAESMLNGRGRRPADAIDPLGDVAHARLGTLAAVRLTGRDRTGSGAASALRTSAVGTCAGGAAAAARPPPPPSLRDSASASFSSKSSSPSSAAAAVAVSSTTKVRGT